MYALTVLLYASINYEFFIDETVPLAVLKQLVGVLTVEAQCTKYFMPL